jgi:hypothetical protein
MLLVGSAALCAAGARRLRAAAPRLRRGMHASAPRASSAAPAAMPPKAAALIIGNEVLSGKIQDTNSVWLARMLYARGGAWQPGKRAVAAVGVGLALAAGCRAPPARADLLRALPMSQPQST